MSEKVNLDLKSLKFIFSKNKSFIFPIVIILVSVILFFQFVIPQFKSLLRAQKDAKELSLKLEVLKKNLDALANINDDVISSQAETLSSALPLSKDFMGILNSVYSAAQRSGVSLGNFSFRVGDLTKSESGESFPVVKLSVPVNSSIAGINSFAEAISRSLPLSEVSSVETGSTSSIVSLSFYYKPLNASDYSQDARINSISQKGLVLINQMNEYRSASSLSVPQVLVPSAPTATSSAGQ